MSATVDHWKTQLIALSPSDRVELAHFLLSSLEPEDEGIEAAWDQEASKRAEEIRSGQATGRPIEEFLAEMRERPPVKPLTIHAEAEAEAWAAIDYYESRRSGLGREFRLQFEAAVDRIRRMPQAFATFDDRGIRKHRLQRFPYTVYYVERDDSIWIAAVAHQRRRPGYWSGRAPEAGAEG